MKRYIHFIQLSDDITRLTRKQMHAATSHDVPTCIFNTQTMEEP
ncbi:MAG TPA: hypothetical protein DEF41_00165 [Desulfovibrio sp.]|nr:hypothetical protein [Desulfovibrio sp.]